MNRYTSASQHYALWERPGQMERAWPNAQIELDFTEKAESIRFFWESRSLAFLGHRYAISGNMLCLFWTDAWTVYFGRSICFFREACFAFFGHTVSLCRFWTIVPGNFPEIFIVNLQFIIKRLTSPFFWNNFVFFLNELYKSHSISKIGVLQFVQAYL